MVKNRKSWENPTKDAIKSNEVFQAYRNDKRTIEGGVFILVHNDTITVE